MLRSDVKGMLPGTWPKYLRSHEDVVVHFSEVSSSEKWDLREQLSRISKSPILDNVAQFPKEQHEGRRHLWKMLIMLRSGNFHRRYSKCFIHRLAILPLFYASTKVSIGITLLSRPPYIISQLAEATRLAQGGSSLALLSGILCMVWL